MANDEEDETQRYHTIAQPERRDKEHNNEKRNEKEQEQEVQQPENQEKTEFLEIKAYGTHPLKEQEARRMCTHASLMVFMVNNPLLPWTHGYFIMSHAKAMGVKVEDIDLEIKTKRSETRDLQKAKKQNDKK